MDGLNYIGHNNFRRNSKEHSRTLASRLQAAREEERALIARELHDEFAQTLTALKLDLEWVQRKLPPEDENLHTRIQEMSGIVEHTMGRVWQLATELRPKLLDDLGLWSAIRWQLQKFEERTGLICRHTIDGNEEQTLDRDLEIAIFRIFQEALSNVARHSYASQVTVTISFSQKQLLLSVEDNGIGISQEKVSNVDSLGLTGMRERAEAFGGNIKIAPSTKQGTILALRIPLSDAPT